MVKIRKFMTNRFTVYHQDSFSETLDNFNKIIASKEYDDTFGNLNYEMRFSEAVRRLILSFVKKYFKVSGAETEEERKRIIKQFESNDRLKSENTKNEKNN